MKKLVTTLALIAFITPAIAEQFFDLEWAEIAPHNFKNVKTDGLHWTVDGRYWANRREMFEKRAAQCNTLSGEAKDACYKELRNIEMEATRVYNEGSYFKSSPKFCNKSCYVLK